MTEQKFAEFFAVMAGIFGHKWTSQYGDNPDSITARVWNDGLSGLTLHQIAHGVKHYKNVSLTAFWPPSLPEFRAVALNIPSLAQARFAIAQNENSDFARLLRSKIDTYALQRADNRTAEKMVADAYELAIIALSGSQAVLEPMPELPKPAERKPASPEHVAKMRESIEKITKGMTV